MKTKSIGKVLSVILSICMLISLFTCLGGLSASATSTNMIVWNAAPAYSRLLYRPNTGKFEAGTKYVLSFDIELTNITEANEPFYWRVFYCNNNSTFTRIAHANFDITKTALKNGYHYDVKFTVPTDCRNYQNILLKFGDTGSNGYEQTMKLANLDLWSLDGDDNQVSQIELSVPSAISDIQQVTDANQKNNGVNGAWVCPKDYLKNITIESQNGYFDPVVKMLSVNSPDTSARLKWRPTQNTNVINPSTDYRLSFYWENISNASLDDNNMFYVKYYNNSSWSVMLKANDPDGGAATDVTVTRTDVAHGQKVDIDFTSPADCRAGSEGGSIFFLFGDWAYSHANMQFNFGELKLYTRDGSDNLTEVAMDDICANSVLGNNGNSDWASSDGLSRGQVYAPSARHSCISFQNVPDGYFDEIEPIDNTGTPKMANVYYGYGWKAFEYNDVAAHLQAGETYVFTIIQRVFSGTPTVGLSNHSNEYFSSNYTTNYSDVTSGITRTITFTMTQAVSDLRIRVGNYSDNTDVAASFANPSLVKQGTSENLIAEFTDNNFVISSDPINRKWRMAGYSGFTSNQAYLDYQDIPEGYFTGTAQANMYYVEMAQDIGTSYAGLDKSVKLETNTEYILELDWRTYGGAFPFVYVSAIGVEELTQTALSGNTVNGVSQALTNNRLPDSVKYGAYGHYAVRFTTPDTLNNGNNNVKISCRNDVFDDAFNYARGATYYGNFKLRKATDDSSVNFILNGDLTIATPGDISYGSTSVEGFEISLQDNKRTALRILPQPDNFFTEQGAEAQKMVKFNGGDYDYIRQEFLLEPSTTYRLYYNVTCVNAECGQFIQYFDSSNASHTISPSYVNIDDATQTKYVVFTTDSDLRTKHSNAIISLFIGRNAPDAVFYFADVQLRKWNGTSVTGPNLINNGGFYFGGELKDENAVTVTPTEESTGRSPGEVQLNGWKLFGKFQKNVNIEVINLTDNFFAGHKRLELRLPLLRKMLLGLQARENSPYEDINGDSDFNVKDYARTKLLWIESETGSATTVAANNFKSCYVNGDNTTNLDTMDVSLFGNKTRPTGTRYYVDADNGNDSNNGTSPSTAWKTLNKVNSTSLSSGSAVLFKCGQVWRAKTGECTSTDTNKGALRCQNGVTYGSYGSGAKPIICGSYYNYASRTWTSAGTNIWKTNINLSGYYHGNDVGIIVYNYGSLIGKMTLKKADLANEGDFWCREPNGTDGGDGNVYVYCTENPADHWRSIEIGQKRNICDLANNCTVNNICFKYGGLHGLTGSNLSAVCISNCEIAYIGGAYNTSRLGNGVELALTAANCRVKNCYVRECYDAGLTFQCWTGTGSFQSINFSNNLIENCNYSIEYFVENASDKMQDIYIMNNICRGAGYGWSYDERVGYSKNVDDIGCYRTAHIRCTASGDLRYTNLSEFYIQNNIFDCSKGALIFWWWNASDSASPFDYDGLHISGNTLYQAANSDDRIIQFRDESAIYGSSTYSVREALKKFEGTDTPAHLNDSKYVLPERVISNY